MVKVTRDYISEEAIMLRIEVIERHGLTVPWSQIAPEIFIWQWEIWFEITVRSITVNDTFVQDLE